MTAIGIAHYGGALGLYNQPNEEISRVLAYYQNEDDLRAAAAAERTRRGRMAS